MLSPSFLSRGEYTAVLGTARATKGLLALSRHKTNTVQCITMLYSQRFLSCFSSGELADKSGIAGGEECVLSGVTFRTE